MQTPQQPGATLGPQPQENGAARAGQTGTDPILYWNAVALEANRTSHTNGEREQTGPTLSSRALGIVHLAMYDAYAGVAGNPADLPPYLTGLPAPEVNASEAAAAHATLSALFPSQKAFFDRKHATGIINWYVGKVQRATASDEAVCRVLAFVTGLIIPPESLFQPKIALRVLRHSLLHHTQPATTAAPEVPAPGTA